MYLGTGEARARLREFDFFAADSWRMRSNLTINYGVRYALQFPFYPMNNALHDGNRRQPLGRVWRRQHLQARDALAV